MTWQIVYQVNFTWTFSIDNNFLLMPEGANLLILEGKGLRAVSQSVVLVKHTNHHCLPSNKNQQIQW